MHDFFMRGLSLSLPLTLKMPWWLARVFNYFLPQRMLLSKYSKCPVCQETLGGRVNPVRRVSSDMFIPKESHHRTSQNASPIKDASGTLNWYTAHTLIHKKNATTRGNTISSSSKTLSCQKLLTTPRLRASRWILCVPCCPQKRVDK